MGGSLVISLDFELWWGVRDTRAYADYGANVAGVHGVIPKLLDLFDRYEIRSTWATVGMAMCDGWDEWRSLQPEHAPGYVDRSLNPYGEHDRARASNVPDALFFAPGLVGQIVNQPGQELGCHTFSHFYCLEEGITDDDFHGDLQLFKRITETKFGLTTSSIVFARNQYSETAIRVAHQEGMTTYRGNPSGYGFQPIPHRNESAIRRGLRLADAVVPGVSGRTYRSESEECSIGQPINVPASFFLRSVGSLPTALHKLSLHRVTQAIRYAAQHERVVHVWWHPHNFGVRQDENLAALTTVLDCFRSERDSGRLQSRNMGDFARKPTTAQVLSGEH